MNKKEMIRVLSQWPDEAELVVYLGSKEHILYYKPYKASRDKCAFQLEEVDGI